MHISCGFVARNHFQPEYLKCFGIGCGGPVVKTLCFHCKVRVQSWSGNWDPTCAFPWPTTLASRKQQQNNNNNKQNQIPASVKRTVSLITEHLNSMFTVWIVFIELYNFCIFSTMLSLTYLFSYKIFYRNTLQGE